MKTVVLVGAAQTSRHLVDWDIEGAEYWTLNEFATPRYAWNAPEYDFHIPLENEDKRRFIRYDKITRLFQLHPRWSFTRDTNHNYEQYWQWLQEEHPFDIMMIDEFEDVPNCVKYPLDELIDHFGEHSKYFTNTFAYMVAQCIHEGAEHIIAHGWEMASSTEYAHQKASAEYWLGRALQAGIQLSLPPDSQLLGGTERLYGYEYEPGVNRQWHEIRKNELFRHGQKALADLNKVMGAIAQKTTETIVPLEQQAGEYQKQLNSKLPQQKRQIVIRKLNKLIEKELPPHYAERQVLQQEADVLHNRVNAFRAREDEQRLQLRMIDEQRPPPVMDEITDEEMEIGELHPSIQLPEGNE